jgi:hypothetical protein
MTLTEISKAHRNAHAVAQAGVTVCPVASMEIEAFDSARREFHSAVDRLQAGEPWKKFASLCAEFHARVCRTPCRPSWLFETFKARLQDLAPQLHARRSSVDPVIQSAYEAVCNRLAVVKQMETNPLATEVQAMLDLCEEDSQKCIVVIRKQELWPEVLGVLKQEERRICISIMKPSEVRRALPVDRLILFGPPWLFAIRDELFLFRASAANNINLFLYRHESGGEVRLSELDNQLIPFNGFVSKPPSEEHLASEPLSMFKPKTFVHRNFSGEDDSDASSNAMLIAAWAINLGGDKGTYLDPEGRVFCVECEHKGEQAICSGVERRDVDELDIGDLIVLTTEGSGDLIRPYADVLLGERAQILRLRQADWKRRLGAMVEAQGVTLVAKKLKEFGSQLANPGNLRNWIGDSNIGPSNLENDFDAILHLIGLYEAHDDYHEAIDQIRSTHHTAGIHLHNRLRDALKGLDVRQAFVEGSLEVRTEANGPAKTIFVVEQITRGNTQVPSYAIGRVFEFEETA